MTTLEAALGKALDFLERSDIGWNPATMRLMSESVSVDGNLAVVPYNTIAFLNTGDYHAHLLGNNPVVVDLETGECRFMGCDEEIGDY